jgi:AcrR family transcriptional regulator
MTKREDGQETRRRLLNAACDVFAEKSYREAKVADICKRAGANVASVNYYFGDKASLYKEAWQHALKTVDEPAFSKSASGGPEDHLREYIKNLIQGFSEKGRSGRFSRLYMREMVNPTGLIQVAWHDIIEPKRQKIQTIIRDIAGPETEELSILLCELSIINQCRALVTVKRSDLEYILGRPLGPELINRMADHIATFSLAGIHALAAEKQDKR